MATKSLKKVSQDLTQSVEVVPAKAETKPALSFIVASDRVRTNAEQKVADLTAKAGVASFVGQKASEMMSTEYLRLRRMFPAVDAVRAILGDDAPDLAGRSPEYKAALGRINAKAEQTIIDQLVSDGMTLKGATATAKDEMETARKSVSRYIRLSVEREAKAILASQGREAAATFLLGHGFGFSGEVARGKDADPVIPSKQWALTRPEGAGDDVKPTLSIPSDVTIASNGRDVVKVNQQAEPNRPSDQAPAEQTADAQLARLLSGAGISVGDPVGLVNLAVGILNGASDLVLAPDTALSVAQRNACRKAVHASATRLIRALAGQSEQAEKEAPAKAEPVKPTRTRKAPASK